MARTRSVLIDNTIGRIFRNVSRVGEATAANLIAGTKIESAAISAPKKTLARPSINIGNGKGLYFPGGALVTSVTLSAIVPPTGDPIKIRSLMGLTYDTAAEIGDYTLNSASYTTEASITVPAGYSVFFDILQVGTLKPGAGFSVRLGFYRG